MSAGDGLFSVVTTYPNGARTFYLFPAERETFLYLEEKGVTYYAERGVTVLADGCVYEYGRVGE